MSEMLLVTHCSPTLAGMKVGNLFSCSCYCTKQLKAVVSQWNKVLNPKGVYVKIMKYEEERVLIYVYRKMALLNEINRMEIKRFLEGEGYEYSGADVDIESILNALGRKLRIGDGFPHEIGIFLGYPFEDVLGFIENEGKNYKHVGYWKVYSDECAAKKLFSKYKKCTNVYCRCWNEGTCISRLTIDSTCLTKKKLKAASF